MLFIEIPIQMYTWEQKESEDEWKKEEEWEHVPSFVDNALINPDEIEEIWSIDEGTTGIRLSGDDSRREVPMKYGEVIEYIEYCNKVIAKEMYSMKWINIIRWHDDWKEKDVEEYKTETGLSYGEMVKSEQFKLGLG